MFEIRKVLVVNAPLGIVFEHPTIKALAIQVDHLRQGDFGLAAEQAVDSHPNGAHAPGNLYAGDGVHAGPAFAYASDAAALSKTLQTHYKAPERSDQPKSVFLTGATGFLGAFILRELMGRPDIGRVVCHVRADGEDAALRRLKESGESRGAWDPEWVASGRIDVAVGDLESRQLGLSDDLWEALGNDVDIIIHNGALVHWVYPYSKLRPANVVATLAAMQLASMGKPKTFIFVSSTAVLEKPHYVSLSDAIVQKGGKGVPEDDNLEASSTGLTSGYGQSKWVGEKLVLEAGRRGLRGGIIRPAYVVGDSVTAVTNTDDFIWRLVKGCVQLGLIPDINNTINMLPVDHVARCTVAAAVSSPSDLKVFHLTARPLPRFNTFLGSLKRYGFSVEREDYLTWRTRLEQHVVEIQDNALFPLLHFVLDDLPTSTKTAELDDTNTIELLRRSQTQQTATVGTEEMGRYLAWLVAVGFLDRPQRDGLLPALTEGAKATKAIGRSGR